MDRAYWVERIWYESAVPIFLERFILPMLAAVVIAVIVLNPFKFDWHQRAGLLLVVIGLAYFVARTVQLGNQPPQSKDGGGSAGGGVALGDCNGVNTGSGSKVDVNCGNLNPKQDKK